METQIKMHRGTPRRAILLIGQTYRTSSGSVVVVDKIAGGYITGAEPALAACLPMPLRAKVGDNLDRHIEWERSSGGRRKEGL